MANGRLRRIGLLLAAAGLMGVLSEASQARSLPPRDECSADPSFRAFRAKLLKAIARKDKRYLLSIVSPAVQNGTDGDAQRGQAVFIEGWALHQPARSPVWAELKTILMLGCAREDGRMIVPYLSAARFSNNLDESSVIAIKPGTILRAAPQRTASTKARLSWDILTEINRPSVEWIHVHTSDGRSGYVERQAVRSPLGFRAIFETVNDRWMMTTLKTGD